MNAWTLSLLLTGGVLFALGCIAGAGWHDVRQRHKRYEYHVTRPRYREMWRT